MKNPRQISITLGAGIVSISIIGLISALFGVDLSLSGQIAAGIVGIIIGYKFS